MFGHDDQQQPTTTDNAAPVTADEPTAAAPVTTDTATSPYIATDEPTVPRADLATTAATGGGNDDLLNIKQQALKQLSPLVDHLDQTPEEKFRTTMMMIQASDDQNLIKPAYEAAQAITDEKTRAQALLDIVNEINYFTQHPDGN